MDEIRSKIVSMVILSPPLSQLEQRNSGHLSMEQCRSVNPFMPTGVFNPFKLTGRSVIMGSLVLLDHFTEIVVSFKQTA